MHFILLELLLGSQYLFRSPHRISKRFQIKKQSSTIYTFGETPLTTLDTIARQARILSHDTVYELGCGSGRTCFWLNSFVKCKVVGIDYLPSFIHKANRVKKWLGLRQIEFLDADFCKVNLKNASVIYLYGTCLEDQMIEQLIKHFSCLQPKTRVISVSYPLTDYARHQEFKLIKQFTGRFPWGEAEIFLNEKL